MPGARTAIGVGIVALAAVLVGCGGAGGRKNGGGRPPPIPRDYKITESERLYIDRKIMVKEVDRSRLAEGVVAITIENQTDEFLADLAYWITLYYRNRNEDPTRRAAMPYVPETTKRRRIDLDARERTTLVVKKGVLSPGASDVFLRIRTEKPVATGTNDTFMSGRVKVVSIDRDWFTKPPSVRFTVRNEWDGPLRLQFKVLLIKDDAVFKETGWKNAPGILPPGGQAVLEANLSGTSVTGTLPALKVRRPRI